MEGRIQSGLDSWRRPLGRGDHRRGPPPLTLSLGTGQSQEERASKGGRAPPSQGTNRLVTALLAPGGARYCSKTYPTPPGLLLINPTHTCLTSFLPRWPSWLLRPEPCLHVACGALLHGPQAPHTGGQQVTLPDRRPDKAAPSGNRWLRPRPPPLPVVKRGQSQL